MSDLIRRQDAIDALKKYEELESDNFTDTSPISMMTVGTIANCIEAIENVPSAEPERKWIPCNERLPLLSEHVDDMVLVCYGNGSIRFDSCMNGEWVHGNPIAWMPLPEPWRGEK